MLKVTQPTTIQDAILRADILTDEAISYGTLSKSNEKRKAVEETGKSGGSMEFEQGTCYECGSREHFRNTYPKLNRAPGQVGNRLTIKGNQNTRNNQATRRAFNVNVKAVEALQDPNVYCKSWLCDRSSKW
ncbi:reverse transcriptase domain-containing protein [Tanacetum coccineum]